MIVADTGGILALLDRDDRHHERVRQLFEEQRATWIVPWAILPEVDYLAIRHLGEPVAHAFRQDVRDGVFVPDANVAADLPRAIAILERYASLGLGLVDAVVMAQAERHRARTIVTTDARHFRAVELKLKPYPKLVPLDA